MKAVIQRVKHSSVKCEDVYNEIDEGFNVLLGVAAGDTVEDSEYIVHKIVNLRVFCDENGKMNRSIKDVNGEILLISQFTLLADTSRGNRPSFIGAAAFEDGRLLYEYTARLIKEEGVVVKKGVYGGDMCVEIINDGPVTIIIDSKNK